MKYWNNLFVGALAITLLSACGGSGDLSGTPAALTYSGLTTPAGITVTNAEVLSTKATDASEEAIAQNTAKEANPFGIVLTPVNSDINPLIIRITKEVVTQVQADINLPTGLVLTYTDLGGYPLCGGSVTVPDNFGANNLLNGSITYNNLCYDDSYYGQIYINGTLTFTQTASNITIRYSNFRATGTGLPEAISINMTVSCDTSFTSCSISADFEGTDGKVYRVANLTVSGTGTGPYTINATFYHPDYGYATIASTGITYTCSNGYPSAGTINITGASGSSANISFTSCDGYSGTWNNGTTSGTFDGTWL
jgi:hypothetical protein